MSDSRLGSATTVTSHSLISNTLPYLFTEADGTFRTAVTEVLGVNWSYYDYTTNDDRYKDRAVYILDLADPRTLTTIGVTEYDTEHEFHMRICVTVTYTDMNDYIVHTERYQPETGVAQVKNLIRKIGSVIGDQLGIPFRQTRQICKEQFKLTSEDSTSENSLFETVAKIAHKELLDPTPRLREVIQSGEEIVVI